MKCKYCSDDYLHNKSILNNIMDCGILGCVYVRIKLGDRNGTDKVRQLNTKVSFVSSGCLNDFMEIYTRNIKYCPMCGRKLEGEKNGIT